MPSYATNKKARFDYEILDTFEAGIVLSGQEVKAVRDGQAKLAGAFISFHGDETRIINMHIAKYRFATIVNGYDPERSRVLLLKKSQVDYLRGKSAEQGLTVIPLSIYTKGSRIKVEIAVGRGKKKFDKRETIKKRDVKRELQRKMKE